MPLRIAQEIHGKSPQWAQSEANVQAQKGEERLSCPMDTFQVGQRLTEYQDKLPVEVIKQDYINEIAKDPILPMAKAPGGNMVSISTLPPS